MAGSSEPFGLAQKYLSIDKVGALEGDEEGALLGAREGVLLGDFEGMSVTGDREGDTEGTLLGADDGLLVGTIGLLVGDEDGSRVGIKLRDGLELGDYDSQKELVEAQRFS